MQPHLFYHCYHDYLFMPLYRSVSTVPVFHRLLTAETADPVSRAGEVEAGLGQPLCWHLLGQAGATERV